ncbi:MAG: hypothetical protein PHR21_07915, partial [Oscillospiraceae bacterium]|nr:hypothetical protein [Oscillospiraceae bacterium]
TREDLIPWAPARPAESHKGSFGKCLLWAGSPGLGGAAILDRSQPRTPSRPSKNRTFRFTGKV